MNYKLLIGFFGLLLLVSQLVSAETGPTLYWGVEAESFAPNSELSVGLFIDSDRALNAFDIEISYSSSTLEFLSFNNSHSIIDFWRREPASLEEGLFTIQGGSSPPFKGRQGEIGKLNFRAFSEGQAQLSFRKALVYYADGLGTLAPTNNLSLGFRVLRGSALTSLGLGTDKEPPLILEAEVARNPVDNSHLAVFAVADKESGVKSVSLRSRQWFSWNSWQAATNPVPLAAGSWSFELKVVDNGGNSTEKTIYVWQELLKKTALFILIILGAYYLIKFYFKKKFVILK